MNAGFSLNFLRKAVPLQKQQLSLEKFQANFVERIMALFLKTLCYRLEAAREQILLTAVLLRRGSEPSHKLKLVLPRITVSYNLQALPPLLVSNSHTKIFCNSFIPATRLYYNATGFC